MIDPQAILTSCQQLAAVWVDALQLASTALGTGIVLATVLKVFATLYLNRQQLKQLQNTPPQMLPTRLQSLIAAYNFPANQILLTRDGAHQAYTIGLWKPTIVLHQHLVKTASFSELEAVFLHEYYHATHQHPLLLTITKNTAHVLFFLPIVQDLYESLAEYCEQAADRFAVAEQQTNQHVLSALKKVLHTEPAAILAVPFSAPSLESRITALTRGRLVLRPLSLVKVGLSLATVFVLLLLSSSQQQIKANLTANMHVFATEQHCSILQCASTCLSTATTFSPNVTQSRL